MSEPQSPKEGSAASWVVGWVIGAVLLLLLVLSVREIVEHPGSLIEDVLGKLVVLIIVSPFVLVWLGLKKLFRPRRPD